MNNPNTAINFGKSVDGGHGINKGYSFVYNFIPRRSDTWVPGGALAANLNGIGVAVAAGATVQHAIRIDKDYNYYMTSFRYTAYFIDAVGGDYEWYAQPAGWHLTLVDPQTAIGTQYLHFLRVSVWFDPSGQFLYGGKNLDAASGRAGGLIPLPIDLLQGYEYGYGQLRTARLLPSDGNIVFEITNTHATANLIVGGSVHGYKVRL